MDMSSTSLSKMNQDSELNQTDVIAAGNGREVTPASLGSQTLNNSETTRAMKNAEPQESSNRVSSGNLADGARPMDEFDVTVQETEDQTAPQASSAITWRLYLSHFLSTWSSRSFEFGSVLFLAHIYPDTLLYLSIYAMCRSAAGIALSTNIGKAIDRNARLQVVRLSIGRLLGIE